MTYAQPKDFEIQNALHRVEPRFVPVPFLNDCEHSQRRFNKEMSVCLFVAGESPQQRSSGGRHNLIGLPLCQCELADPLGLIRETFSRKLANLSEQGVIECHGPRQIETLDIGTSEDVSGGDTDGRGTSYETQ